MPLSQSAKLHKITPERLEEAMAAVREACDGKTKEDEFPPIFDQIGSLASVSEEIKSLFKQSLMHFTIKAMEGDVLKAYSYCFASVVKNMLISAELAVQDPEKPREADPLESMDLDLTLTSLENGTSGIIREAAANGEKMERMDKYHKLSGDLVRVREILRNKGLV